MRTFLLITIISLFSNKIDAQVGPYSKLEDFRLIGHVRKITITEFDSTKYVGNFPKGQLTPKDLSSPEYSTMQFDTNGLLQKIIYYGTDGQIKDFRTFVFDNKTRLLKHTIHNHNSIYNIWSFSYPDSCSVVIDITYPSDKKESSKEIYKLRQDGKIRQVLREYYKSDTLNFWSKQFMTHDPNMTSMHRTSMDDNSVSYLDIIDEHGNSIESIKIDGSIIWRTYRKFDDKSMILEEKTVCKEQTTIEKFSYQFDSYGNWIKKWTVKDGMSKFITTREILYY